MESIPTGHGEVRGASDTMDAVSSPWSVIIPVKRPDVAKSRLADAVGEVRPELARAFAADTLTAVLASTRVTSAVVVTDDPAVAADATTAGALVVEDAPAAGLNAALRHGAAALVAQNAEQRGGLVALAADLPALRSEELDRCLDAAADHPTSIVSDAAGTGTTMYAAVPPADFQPLFGGRSRAAHRSAGALEIDRADVPSVRRDVDTAVDLWDAQRMGLGPRSAALLNPRVCGA